MRRLPDEVYATLRATCAAYPYAVVQTAADLGAVLNRVAWAHRADGWGLSRKDFGTCVPSPVGLIAEDVLHHRPSNFHWDVLAGAGVGQPLRPTQTDAIGPMTDPRRPWVAPANPGGDVSVPTPPVDVHACTFRPTDLAPVQAQLAALQAQLATVAGQVQWLSDRLLQGGQPDPSMLEHIDDVKRMVAGLPRDERFL